MKNTTRFEEDFFDLAEHKKAADTIIKSKAREERVRRQVKYGKFILAIVMILIFFLLIYGSIQLGIIRV